jgi:4-aminobutyrate aminotransferase
MTELYSKNSRNMSPVWSRIFTIEAERAEGSYIYATDGKKYLDFTCGIGVANTGHCHPKVVAAIREQAGLFLHGQTNIVVHQPMLRFIEELKTIAPPGIDGYFFSNSGAEAVEGAVKLARAASGKQNVIVFAGSFHGRTAATMALTTSKTGYKAGNPILPSGVYIAPYPYPRRLGMEEEAASAYCLESLEDLFASQSAPNETAAVLIESVLGEGGYVPPPKSFMKGLRELCTKNDVFLIFDEVQCGFGRTAKFFAQEHYGVTPDIMTAAKGIASGMPLSGVFSSLDLMKKWPTGSHGGTYGGNPVSMAAGVATIRAMKEEGMLANAEARGEQLRSGLRKIAARHPELVEVRGLGLMVGSEFALGGSGLAGAKGAKSLVKATLKSAEERGLLLLSAGTYDSTIRWIPPLNVSAAEIDEGLGIFSAALDGALGSAART